MKGRDFLVFGREMIIYGEKSPFSKLKTVRKAFLMQVIEIFEQKCILVYPGPSVSIISSFREES